MAGFILAPTRIKDNSYDTCLFSFGRLSLAKLVTGGLGFIGSHLARKLVENGEQVVLFDVVEKSKLVDDILVRQGVKSIRGDLGNWAQVLHVVKEHKIDGIYHTGALLSASAEENPLTAYMVNAGGTFHILEAARLFNVGSVILLSTIATYGPGVPARVGDDVVQRPTTMYGVTKVFGELLGEYYHRKFGVNFRGLRLPSVIGPGRKGGGVSAYSSLIVQEPAAGRPYEVYVDEEARIPLLYIEDALRAIFGIEQAREGNLKRRVYNVQGFSPSASDLARAVKKYMPDAGISFRPVAEMVEIARSWPRELDDDSARKDWGWKTEYTLDRAVRDFVEEFRARKDRYD